MSLEAALSSKQRDLSHRLDTASWEMQMGQASKVEQAALPSEASVEGGSFSCCSSSSAWPRGTCCFLG